MSNKQTPVNMSTLHKEKVDKADILLIPGKEENYWHIFHQNFRAGYVSIKKAKGKKSRFITVILNKKSQGKGIGAIAFQLACENSSYTTIYANISKKNIASLISAERAGFKIDRTESNGQLILKWRAKTSSSSHKKE
ncbi:GNAT family protein [Paenibacillus campi]|uniref:GNAT family N-acetyltransferase n=1 Tax=Paenibacillus campi TaxID=3106031 RepID=UPI002AFF6722|nr:GNAT family protein [Paenibacillus sp. SGZ-1014]